MIPNEPDSCLGVIGLSLSALLIASIQLMYSFYSLARALTITTNDHSSIIDIHSLTTIETLIYSQQIFICATSFIAACVLGIGTFM